MCLFLIDQLSYSTSGGRIMNGCMNSGKNANEKKNYCINHSISIFITTIEICERGIAMTIGHWAVNYKSMISHCARFVWPSIHWAIEREWRITISVAAIFSLRIVRLHIKCVRFFWPNVDGNSNDIIDDRNSFRRRICMSTLPSLTEMSWCDSFSILSYSLHVVCMCCSQSLGFFCLRII